MKSLDSRTAKLKGGLTLINIEESGMLLDIENRCYYDLNDTAFFLARRLETGCQYDNLQAKFVAEFNIDEETARLDMENFLLELARKDLLTIGETNTKSGGTLEVKRGVKPYQAPTFNYRKELIVASTYTQTVTR